MHPRELTSPETRTLDLEDGVELDCGATLTPVRVAYRTWGNRDATGDNAVLVCHALTGSADVDRWWGGLLGPGRALDPTTDFVVCANVLGSCYGTTGPADPDPATGAPYGPDFPEITVRDMVRLQRLLLARLGVRRLRAVVGGSLGGMQALEWAATFPDQVGCVVAIATSGRHSPWCIALSEAQRAAIRADRDWQGGHYAADRSPAAGLAAARMMAMCTYRSHGSFADRFGRDASAGDFESARYLRHHGDALVRRFDANSYLTLTRAMDTHDLARGRGPYREVLRRIAQPALVVAVSSDVLYPPEEQRELARGLPDARLVTLRSPHGHDAFLIHQQEVDRVVTAFRRQGRQRRVAVPQSPPPVRVLKFGGTSVADADRLRRVAGIVVEASTTCRPVVVVSALAGVTDALAALGGSAVRGEAGWRDPYSALAGRHLQALTSLGGSPVGEAELDARLAELADLLQGISLTGECSDSLRARLLAAGERLSVILVAAAVEAAGRGAEPVDGSQVLRTVGPPAAATADLEATRGLARRRLAQIPPGVVPVVTGFVGADRDRRTTVLSRGGSDLSATVLGAVLDADRVEIWTDVPGVLTAPPRLLPRARTVPRLSYAAAGELAFFGGKVLHPDTMRPVVEPGIPILVRSSERPDLPGTLVDRDGGGASRVTALAAVERVVLVEVSSARGGPWPPEVLVSSCASAAGAALLVVRSDHAAEVAARLGGRVRPPLAPPGLALVAIVGGEPPAQAWVLGRSLEALARRGVEVHLASGGASPDCVTAVVDGDRLREALEVLHEALWLGREISSSPRKEKRNDASQAQGGGPRGHRHGRPEARPPAL